MSVLPKVKAGKGKICWFKRVPPGGMEIVEERKDMASTRHNSVHFCFLVKSDSCTGKERNICLILRIFSLTVYIKMHLETAILET